MRASKARSISEADVVWRNWQLGEGARPGGDEASSTRRRNKEKFERRREERLCFKRSRGSVTSVNALTTVTGPASETSLRVKIKGKLNTRVWRNWQTR